MTTRKLGGKKWWRCRECSARSNGYYYNHDEFVASITRHKAETNHQIEHKTLWVKHGVIGTSRRKIV